MSPPFPPSSREPKPWRVAPLLALVGSQALAASPSADAHPNILLIVADDVGVDQSACYDAPAVDRAPQPNLENLCRNAVAFNRAWANPYCSPTRAGLLTGRYSFRTGVGEPLGRGGPGPSLDEYTLPQALDAVGTGYTHAVFGKWHLSDDDNGGNDHPNLAGFDHFAGAMAGQVEDFWGWTRVEDGVEEWVTDYATSRTVDDALSWIGAQEGPWFAQVSFHAPHWPLHLPPLDLHSYDDLSGDPADIAEQPELYYQAMLEAMDTELGRMLEGIGPEVLRNTVIIYVGDNGTQENVNQGAFAADHAKGTLYQGGVHVPLFVTGRGVVGGGRRVPHLVNTVDLFATVLELAGGEPELALPEGVVTDSVSIVPYLADRRAPARRDWVLAEVFGPNVDTGKAGQAIYDGQHKLLRFGDGNEELYDLRADPDEAANLLDGELSVPAARAWVQLSSQLDLMPLDTAEGDGG